MPLQCAAPLTPWLGTMGLTPLYAAVLVGAAQNVFSKSAKYSLFDPCKEMAYIPLDQETQLKARRPFCSTCRHPAPSLCACMQLGRLAICMCPFISLGSFHM